MPPLLELYRLRQVVKPAGSRSHPQHLLQAGGWPGKRRDLRPWIAILRLLPSARTGTRPQPSPARATSPVTALRQRRRLRWMLAKTERQASTPMPIAHGFRLISAATSHRALAAATTLLKRVLRTVQRARVNRCGQPSSSVAVRIVMSCQRSPISLMSQSAQALSKSPRKPDLRARSTNCVEHFVATKILVALPIQVVPFRGNRLDLPFGG